MMNTGLKDYLKTNGQSLFAHPQLMEVKPKLDAFITEITPKRPWHHGQLTDFASGRQIVALPTTQWRWVLLAALEQLLPLELEVAKYRHSSPDHTMWGGSTEAELLWQQRMNLSVAVRALLRRQLPLNAQEITLLLLWLDGDDRLFGDIWLPMTQIIMLISRHFEAKPECLEPQQRALLATLKTRLEPLKSRKDQRTLYAAIDALLDDRPRIQLKAGEAWSDAAIAELKALEGRNYQLWCELIKHCKGATAAKPTQKWRKAADLLSGELGMAAIKTKLLPWLKLVALPRTAVIEDWQHLVADPNRLIIDEHMDILRGLVWIVASAEDAEVGTALTELALSCYSKVPGVGERAVKVGSSCIYALGQMPGQTGQQSLHWLRQQLSFKSALKAIDKALDNV